MSSLFLYECSWEGSGASWAQLCSLEGLGVQAVLSMTSSAGSSDSWVGEWLGLEKKSG